jgi:hypothetical protein
MPHTGSSCNEQDCFHTLRAKSLRGEGHESVETISWTKPLRGGLGYGDGIVGGWEWMARGWGNRGPESDQGRRETGLEHGFGASMEGIRG